MTVMHLVTAKTITRICWIAINLSCFAIALKDVHVTVPAAVKRGGNASLTCRYDLEQDNLYSIKWYKGRREFYRFTPRESPPMKVFAAAGIVVERSMSNASSVMLTSVEPAISGKYSCEVSADAPSFHTVIVSGDLEVVDFPDSGPSIDGADRIYSIGDILTANCTLNKTKPPANLTWLINSFPVLPHQLTPFRASRDELSNLETAVLGLKLVLTPKHFRSKSLRIACKAQIYDIYEKFTEKLVELDASTNLILIDDLSTIGESKHQLYDTKEDQNNLQMQHIQVEYGKHDNERHMSLSTLPYQAGVRITPPNAVSYSSQSSRGHVILCCSESFTAEVSAFPTYEDIVKCRKQVDCAFHIGDNNNDKFSNKTEPYFIEGEFQLDNNPSVAYFGVNGPEEDIPDRRHP